MRATFYAITASQVLATRFGAQVLVRAFVQVLVDVEASQVLATRQFQSGKVAFRRGENGIAARRVANEENAGTRGAFGLTRAAHFL